MSSNRRRSLVEYGIPLDLVVIATGASYLLAGNPPVQIAIYLAAVAGGAWFGGIRGGVAATAFSLVGLLFSGEIPLWYFAGFVAAGCLISALVPRLRLRLAGTATLPAEQPLDEQRLARELERARADAEKSAAAMLEREKARIEKETRARIDEERARLTKSFDDEFRGALEAERAGIRKQLESRLAAERARLEKEAEEELERERQAAEEALQRQLDADREELRRRAEEQLGVERAGLRAQLDRDREAVAAPSAPLPTPPYQLALPLLVVLIYWNVSDIFSRIFGIPSLLQPMIVLLAIIIWRNRDVFTPSGIVFQPMTMLLALYCVVVFVSTIWADDLYLADKRMTEMVKNLFVYVLAASLAVSWKSLRHALATLAVAAGALSAISLVQIATGQLFSQLGGFARIKEGNIYADASDIRAAGPVGDPNFYGQILVMVIPVALFLAYSATRRAHRLAWLAVAGAIAGGVLVTYSRGAMLALAIMTAILMAARRMPVMRIAAGTAAVILVIVLLPGNVSRRFLTLIPQSSQGEDRDGSIEKRKLLLATAFRMFDAHPLLGVGAGNFSPNFNEFANRVGTPDRIASRPGDVEHAHTLYLEIGAENGLVGLGVFLAAIGAAFVTSWQSSKRLAAAGSRYYAALPLGLGIALAGYMATSLFLHTGFQRYLWLLLAFIAATRRLAFGDSSRVAEAMP